MYNLGFLNKNTLRKYPFRKTSVLTDAEGEILPDTVICALRLSIPSTYTDVFLSKLVVNQTGVKAFVSAYLDSRIVLLGVFSAPLASDFEMVKFKTTLKTCSGYMAFGFRDAIKELEGVRIYTKDAALFEDSCIQYFTRPTVYALYVSGHYFYGDMTLAGENITISSPSNTDVTLTVKDRAAVKSKGDSGSIQSKCNIPVISTLNGLTPSATGNVDIFAVRPLALNNRTDGFNGYYVTTKDIQNREAPLFTLSSFCDKGAIPPMKPHPSVKFYDPSSTSPLAPGYQNKKASGYTTFTENDYDGITEVNSELWKLWMK